MKQNVFKLYLSWICGDERWTIITWQIKSETQTSKCTQEFYLQFLFKTSYFVGPLDLKKHPTIRITPVSTYFENNEMFMYNFKSHETFQFSFILLSILLLCSLVTCYPQPEFLHFLFFVQHIMISTKSF